MFHLLLPIFRISICLTLFFCFPFCLVPSYGDIPPAVPGSRIALVPGLIREAMTTAEGMTDAGAKAAALCSIGATRARAGNPAGAKQSFAAALQSAGQLTSAAARANMLRDIAVNQSQVNDRVGAFETFGAASQAASQVVDAEKNFDLVSVNVITDIARERRKAGDEMGANLDTEAAKKIIAAAQKKADQNPDKYAQAVLQAKIAMAKTRLGDFTGALLSAGQINAAINPSFAYQKSIALQGIAGGQAKVGDVSGAISTANGIVDGYMKSLALWAIAEAQGRAGDLDAAMKSAGQVPDGYIKSVAYQCAAAALAQAGNVAAARQCAEPITDDFRRQCVLGAITTAQARAGDLDAARSTAVSITDSDLKATAQSDILAAQARLGDAGEAGAAARQISAPAFRVMTLTRVADAIIETAKASAIQK